nr:hypothetical protein [Flavobacterium cellulosilyticum]
MLHHLITECIIHVIKNIWIRTLDQYLLSGTDYLELFKQRKNRHFYGITTPINSYNPITLNFHVWKDIFLDVIKSWSLKEAYAMMFTNPSQLEAVKSEFNSIYLKEMEQLYKADVDFLKKNNPEKSNDLELLVSDQIVKT